MCPMVSCKVDWVIPNVTRQKPNVRTRPIFYLTFHVRKTGMCYRDHCKAYWQILNVTRQELNVRRRSIFYLTFHVRKTGTGKTVKECATERTV